MDGSSLADKSVFIVVVNDEDQYSIWQPQRTLPPGWVETGFSGTKDECLLHIEQIWTDLRPASLRRFMTEAQTGNGA